MQEEKNCGEFSPGLDSRRVVGYDKGVIGVGFIKGFFQRHCQVDTSTPELVTTSGDRGLLERIRMALQTLGIQSTVSPVGDRWRLRVRNLDSLRKWSTEVGFMDAERSLRLDSIIQDLERKDND